MRNMGKAGMKKATVMLAALALAGCASPPAASIASADRERVEVLVRYSSYVLERPGDTDILAAAEAEAARECERHGKKAAYTWNRTVVHRGSAANGQTESVRMPFDCRPSREGGASETN